MEKPWRDLSSFLREKFGEKTDKICLDGGFTCPNRDGRCGCGGCLFCSARGGGEFIKDHALPVGEQMKRGIAAALSSGRRAQKFIAYFQNFSGTYAPTARLEMLYREALADERTVGLAVATRPDCITEENANLLAMFAKTHCVWVELGLQTASDAVARAMNIGYDRAEFSHAVSLLADRGIDTVAHMMVGLPGEGRAEAMRTMEFINRHPVSGIKIHATYVSEGSGLADLFRSGAYTPISREEYTDTAVGLLAAARPDLVIHRLTGDPPKEGLLAPLWCREKIEVLNEILRKMKERGLTQGCRYAPTAR